MKNVLNFREVRFSRRKLFPLLLTPFLPISCKKFLFESNLPQTPLKNPNNIPGQILGGNFKAGHLLRKNQFSKPTKTLETDVVIVGGGISGLSAGWFFERNGFKNFMLLELDKEVGGNTRYGNEKKTLYPLITFTFFEV